MKNTGTSNGSNRYGIQHIQKMIFSTQLILILTLALFLGAAGTMINLHFETQKRDQNLQNIAEAIAHSPVLDKSSVAAGHEDMSAILIEYIDSLKDTLADIDVISVVDGGSHVRLYHSNHTLIGTVYNGTLPEFQKNSRDFYATNDSGPSGLQRRAYAAIYDPDGNYTGFVMAIMLMENIKAEIFQSLILFAFITVAAVLLELIVSAKLSDSIKKRLHGYEPDVFSAMYQIRDNILASLDEGILAIDRKNTIQFINDAAIAMLNTGKQTIDTDIIGRQMDQVFDGTVFEYTLNTGEKEFNVQERRLGTSDILIDCIPIKQDGEVIGAVGILHNRAEYTRLMEDLTGTRYLVDSMRANNHDFTNKLHVILGLIQMELYDEATAYIENISLVQRETISRIMSAVDEPAAAALLIGKNARSSELNVKFVMREGCHYSRNDFSLPSEALVTILGNLIDNALEAMNQSDDSYGKPKELLFGIYSRPGALLITTDDTGTGIDRENLERIFENGYSTKGSGRGTGLYQVKNLVDGLGGTITVESQSGVGTSFSVRFPKERP